jgi:hypothetical protein
MNMTLLAYFYHHQNNTCTLTKRSNLTYPNESLSLPVAIYPGENNIEFLSKQAHIISDN